MLYRFCHILECSSIYAARIQKFQGTGAPPENTGPPQFTLVHKKDMLNSNKCPIEQHTLFKAFTVLGFLI